MVDDLVLFSENMLLEKSTSEHLLITMGRSELNSIQIRDPKVSRFHCKIIKTTTSIEFFDLHSKNGSFVNGTKCDYALLNPGDCLQLGDNILKLAPLAEEGQYDFDEKTEAMPGPRLMGGIPPEANTGEPSHDSISALHNSSFIRPAVNGPLKLWHRIKQSLIVTKPIYMVSGSLLTLTCCFLLFQSLSGFTSSDAASSPPQAGHDRSSLLDNRASVAVADSDRKKSLTLAREADTILSSGEADQSIDLYQKALALDPNNILAKDGLEQAYARVDKLARLYFEKGQSALKAMDFSEAVKEFETVTFLLKDRNDNKLLKKAQKNLRQAKKQLAF